MNHQYLPWMLGMSKAVMLRGGKWIDLKLAGNVKHKRYKLSNQNGTRSNELSSSDLFQLLLQSPGT
jgi:hypothetical protein